MKLGILKIVGLLGVYDVDLVIGYFGVCGGWFDIVFGIEYVVYIGMF